MYPLFSRAFAAAFAGLVTLVSPAVASTLSEADVAGGDYSGDWQNFTTVASDVTSVSGTWYGGNDYDLLALTGLSAGDSLTLTFSTIGTQGYSYSAGGNVLYKTSALQNSAWEGTTLGTVSFSYYNQSQDQSLSLTLGDDFTGTLYLQLYGTYGTLAYNLSIFSANTGSSTDTPQVTVPETTPVPLPAAGVLMMAGLGAFGALRGLRKRAPGA